MLTPEENVEVTALAKRGWTISAIARHVGRDRRTVGAYLRGDRIPGQRRAAKLDEFERFVAYVLARLTDDADLSAMSLYRELVGQGFTQSYPTLTARLRTLGLRPPRSNDAATRNPDGDQEVITNEVAGRAPDPTIPTAVIVPSTPPELSADSARALLRMLLEAR